MKQLLLACAIMLGGCATVNQKMVVAEHLLLAGSGRWDEQVDAKIAECRDQNLPTEAEREACVAPIRKIDETVVAPAVTTGVAALRAFWIARAAGEDPKDVRKHI